MATWGIADPNHPNIVKAIKTQRDLMRELEAEGYDVTREDLGEAPAAQPAPATGQTPAGGRYSGFSATPIG